MSNGEIEPRRLTFEELEALQPKDFPRVVRNEAMRFIRTNKKILVGLSRDWIVKVLESTQQGNQRELQEELYSQMTDRERMAFARYTADRMDEAVSARIRLMVIVSDVAQTLTDMAIAVLLAWLKGL